MYGLPHDFDCRLLVGRQLQQVAVGEYQVQLRFDGKTGISTEAEISSSGVMRMSCLSAGRELIKLVGKKVVSCRTVGQGDLELSFEDADKIVIHDSNKDAESYTIESPSGVWVI